MEKEIYYENYPFWITLVTSLFSLLICLIGTYILLQLGLVWAVLYILYLIFLEVWRYKEGCACCYYYGKVCAFGRGKIAALFFKKDDPKKFCKKGVNWLKLVPNFLVLIIPLIAGIILLIKSFSWLILVLIIMPFLFWFLGNPIIYGRLACKHCQQSQICCPACEFFSKKNRLEHRLQ